MIVLWLTLLCSATPLDNEPANAATVSSATTAPAPAAAGAPRRFLRVAVYDFAVDGVEPRVGRFVTDAMVDELRKLDAVSVVSMDEVRAMLAHEATKQVVGCTEGPSCLSEIGDALGVDEIVVGTLSVVGGVSVATIRRLDQAEGKAVASITERLKPREGEEFVATVGSAAAKLYKDKPLRVGAVRGVPPEVSRRLNPPPLPVWAPVSTGAAALVIAAGAAGFGVASLNEQNAHAALLLESKTTPVPGSLVVERAASAWQFAVLSNVLYGAAAVAGLSTVAMVPFTNVEPVVAE
jgi:hypothetical protein